MIMIKDMLLKTVLRCSLYLQSYPFEMSFNGFKYIYSTQPSS